MTSSYAQTVIDFIAANKANSFTIHSNNPLYLPNILLESLDAGNETLQLKTAIPELNRAAVSNVSTQQTNAEISIIKSLNASNLLFNKKLWYNGDEIIYVCYIDRPSIVLDEKLAQLQTIFNTSPKIHIFIADGIEITEIKSNLQKFQGLDITVTSAKNTPVAINNLLKASTQQYAIVDYIDVNIPISNLLAHFNKENEPLFVFAAPLQTSVQNVDLSDLLIQLMNIDNIAFNKDVFTAAGGFDDTLSVGEMLWDFCVSTLKLGNGNHGLAISSTPTTVAAKQTNNAKNLPAANAQTQNFEHLTEKYSAYFIANFKNILLNVFKNQHVHEAQLLEYDRKIANQNQLLVQSRDEAKSLAELNLSMQQRIQMMESKWHYKLSTKLKHFKGIFFKKSTSGTSTLKKILKFIVFTFSKPGFKIFRKIVKGAFKRMYLITEDRPVNIIYLDTSSGSLIQEDYNALIRLKLNPEKLKEEYNNIIGTLSVKPKISVIMPVYNPPLHFLRDAIESVISQSYTNWELCIADDCSPNPQIQRLLNSYALKDPRIKIEIREENGHISACSNSALALATGDFVLLLDHDDMLTTNCLIEVVKHINQFPDDELIYSDEDKMLNHEIYIDPFFKPDWSPDKLMATNYISHVVTIKKELIDKVGGFRLGYEGSQDYDLMLRCTEIAKHVGHIPKILYHWRIHELSVAGNTDVKPYAYIAGKKALEAALVRRNLPGEVQYTPERGRYRIKYQVRKISKVSIIIPTKDAVSMMKNTIDSILSLTEYPDYEIIVLNNNSTSKQFFELMKDYTDKHSDKFRCVDAAFPFNFSKLMNLGASLSTGEYILMLNNDVEILRGDWITWMVAYAQNETTGAVGVKLLYPDDRIQHAGTVIGLGDDKIAAHAFVGYHKDTPGYFNRLQFVSNYSAVTAACLMVRKSVFDEVGGMDELLEVEYNDVDFCLKIVDKGYYNIYLPEVVLYHYESATRGHPHQDKKSYERHMREINYFRNKWKKYIKHDPFYNPNLSLEREGFSVDYSNYE